MLRQSTKNWIAIFLLTGWSPLTIAQIKKEFYSSEKAYLRTDRSQYVAGDTLWFNAYLVEGPHHTPTALSRTLYVHLLDADGQLTTSSILRIDSTGHAPAILLCPIRYKRGLINSWRIPTGCGIPITSSCFAKPSILIAKTHMPPRKSQQTYQQDLAYRCFPKAGS